MFNFLDTFDGPWDWINVLVIGLLIGVGLLGVYDLASGTIGMILGIVLVLAGVFGMIDGFLIDGLIMKFISFIVFLAITLVGANLVYTIPRIGSYLTPIQSVYSVPGFVFYTLLGVVIAILLIDIFASDSI
ncbi:hypothetical protein KY321_00095 [Candidatus Woesearchaeota archaeon]|nr:hypothetical protein [Candidatus Woesearchaeota archaeon]